jgi:hypothetical protein
MGILIFLMKSLLTCLIPKPIKPFANISMLYNEEVADVVVFVLI